MPDTQEFIMLMGMPGCGKSTWAELYTSAHPGTTVVSSDATRHLLDDTTDNAKVFACMHDAVLEALSDGLSVIYDATNMSRKNRMTALSLLSRRILAGRNVKASLRAWATPLAICKERNFKRTGAARVPDIAYARMLESFRIPMLAEGWDSIEWHDADIPGDTLGTGGVTVPLSSTAGFDQCNRHHTLDLAQHMALCAENVRNDPRTAALSEDDRRLLIMAASLHDIGKPVTQTFIDKHGRETEDAHYYGHDCAGSYLVLSEYGPAEYGPESFSEALRVAELISWHMRPYLVWNKQGRDSRAFRKDLALLGEEKLALIDVLHDADKGAK